jgi:hypothetical protein
MTIARTIVVGILLAVGLGACFVPVVVPAGAALAPIR